VTCQCSVKPGNENSGTNGIKICARKLADRLTVSFRLSASAASRSACVR
jgi:hypothetical protein